MASKELLRDLRKGTKINAKSIKEDKQCMKTVLAIIEELKSELHIDFEWDDRLYLSSIVEALKKSYPTVDFGTPKSKTFMKPDGGITYLVAKNKQRFPILMAEVKNQGTNDIRKLEGKKKQANGNAVERLGKNVIGLKTFMSNESIFPFVCFGDGCDFDSSTTIPDRILTIAMFGELNKDHTEDCGPNNLFSRGSYYFRAKYWTVPEIKPILKNVAKKSIKYYFDKYGEDKFR